MRLGEIDTFQALVLIKFLICSVGLNMDTITGTTDMKMIFSFSPVTGSHFIGNALCSSDDSVTQLLHILQLCMIKKCLLQTTRRKNPKEKILEKEEQGNGPTLSCPTSRKLTVQKGKNTKG
jgi:hypothetical protein